MILVELNGGIGNQMFQYAAAKSLSLHHKSILKLDITPPSDKNMPEELKPRPFDLHNFNITETPAEPSEINSFTATSSFRKLKERFKPNYKRKIYREPHFNFDDNFFKAGSNVYLKGLWQSEKYFLHFKSEIKTAFKFKDYSTKDLTAVSQAMRHQNSISVHIRRGDYLAKISQEVLGLLPSSYFQKAIEQIKLSIENPVFYFFSDDIAWVKENFQFPGAVYVSGEITKTHIEDLYLMTQCRHNIIANSSFSWWGAWLNDNPDKMVIAPKKWFNKGPKYTNDLYPKGWIRL